MASEKSRHRWFDQGGGCSASRMAELPEPVLWVAGWVAVKAGNQFSDGGRVGVGCGRRFARVADRFLYRRR